MKTNRNDQKFLAQKIRAQYTEKGSTALDELKALDESAPQTYLLTSSEASAQWSWAAV